MQGLANGRGEVAMQAGGIGEGAVWTQACAALRGELGEAAFGSYLAPARLRRGRAGPAGRGHPPPAWRATWLRRQRWWRRIGEGLGRARPAAPRPAAQVAHRVRDGGRRGLRRPWLSPERAALPPGQTTRASPWRPPPRSRPWPPPGWRACCCAHSFEGFVAGPANAFALATARQGGASGAAEPSIPSSSTARTASARRHLLQAIAQEAQALRPQARGGLPGRRALHGGLCARG